MPLERVKKGARVIAPRAALAGDSPMGLSPRRATTVIGNPCGF
jgi:hypothetical protein